MGANGAFDLIIIGAGINGAGIARDAALRGLRALLLDKGDVAGGTTAASTRLIHGGLRYLEHGEVRLVRESLRERELLLRLAPHLVQPLPLMIPIYRGDARGPWLIRAGMLAYELLSIGKSLPRHHMLGRVEAWQRAPGLAGFDLLGAALYYDAQVEYPERLALENALDARAHGAVLRTYHEVQHLDIEGGRIAGVQGRDVLTGELFQATAPVVINVAGPWVDAVLGTVEMPKPGRLIGGTKGSHIVVGPFSDAPVDALYAEAGHDHRPFFIIPWNDAYLIGTTDTRFDGDLEDVSASELEIYWLLEEANRLLPNARLSREDVRYSYAGVRPLPYAPGRREGAVTRRHIVVDHGAQGGPRGLFSIVGGKLTTYRALAEVVVDEVFRHAGSTFIPSQTAHTPLPGAPESGSWQAVRRDFLRESGLPSHAAEHLLRVYGERAGDVLATANVSATRAIIDAATGAIAAEVGWALRHEGARTLTDVLARRTMIGLGPDNGRSAAAKVAEIAQRELGWDAVRAASELADYQRWVERYRPVTASTS